MAKLKTESAEPKTAGDMRNSNVRGQLLSFVERYERLQEEKEALADDQKEVMGEAKGMGFDTTILKRAIARRKKPRADVNEADDMLNLYEEALDEAEKAARMASEADGE